MLRTENNSWQSTDFNGDQHARHQHKQQGEGNDVGIEQEKKIWAKFQRNFLHIKSIRPYQ